MRCQCVKDLRANFKSMHQQISCQLCDCEEETQQHLMKCIKLQHIVKQFPNAAYDDLFSGVSKQQQIAKLFDILLKERDLIIAYQGSNTGPHRLC